MRLQKYMALCGVASRRQSEKIIAEGRVKVNGAIIVDPATDVAEQDEVCVDGKTICQDTYVYILLNKPKGIVSTSADAHAEKTVLDIVQCDQRLYTVGRLDKDTEGLILLTNDGDLTFKMTHPKHDFPKTYECMVKGLVGKREMLSLAKGVTIETDDGLYKTTPAEVEFVKKTIGATLLRITITEGKKRQIRKMCAAVGHPVIQLKRIALGDLTDDSLKVGQWRDLTQEEIDYLKGMF